MQPVAASRCARREGRPLDRPTLNAPTVLAHRIGALSSS